MALRNTLGGATHGPAQHMVPPDPSERKEYRNIAASDQEARRKIAKCIKQPTIDALENANYSRLRSGNLNPAGAAPRRSARHARNMDK